VSSHTTCTSTVLQSYDPRSQITNHTLEPHHHPLPHPQPLPLSQKREKEFKTSDPIFEHEEYHERTARVTQEHGGRPSQQSTRGETEKSDQMNSGRLLPPKVSREPELMVEFQKRTSSQQKHSPRSTHSQTERYSNQLELPQRSSSDNTSSLTTRSVTHLPTHRQLFHPMGLSQYQTPPTPLRHSHDGVISRTRHPHHHLFQQPHPQQHSHDSHTHSPSSSLSRHPTPEIRRSHHTSLRESVGERSRSKYELNDSCLQYSAYSSTDSVNGSNLSLSLSSIASSQRHPQQPPAAVTPPRSVDYSTNNRHSHSSLSHSLMYSSPTRSPQRLFSSSSSTVSSLSPQSPDHLPPPHASRTTSTSSFPAPVLWTQRTSKRSTASNFKHSSPAPLTLSFCYCSPQGDVLAISSLGDVVYCTYLPDCHGQLRPCRLCVRAAKPLLLLVGKVNHDMCESIRYLTSLYGPQATNNSSSDSGPSSSSAAADLLHREGIFASSSGTSGGALSTNQKLTVIFEDRLWIKHYKVQHLEGRLQRVYHRVYEMIQMTKRKRPRLILYLISSSSSPGTLVVGEEKGTERSSDSTVVCKCMLMSNLPFPDFYVRWSHGMKLHYSLSDGRLVVHTPPTNTSGGETYRWDHRGMADGADWTVSAPEEMKRHLLQAQKAMKRCLLEDTSVAVNPPTSASSASSEPCVLTERIENLQ
jgi:hypothetical protein